MRKTKVLIPLVLSAIPFVTTNAQMSREEAVVRTTYAKLIYALKIGAIHDFVVTYPNGSLSDLEDRLAAKNLRFELSNFSSGRVAEISKRKYADLVTKPAGEDVLDVSLGTYNFSEEIEATREVKETSETGAQASWSAGQNLAQDWNVPFEQMLPDAETQNKSKYSRYAAFSLTVSFEGRSRSYRAMFLFGTGEVPVLAADNVTNHPALTGLVSKSLYPRVLLESPLARKKAVAEWLKSHRVRDPACRPGQGEACCDPSSMRCGVAAEDVDRAMDKARSRMSKQDCSTVKNLRAVQLCVAMVAT
jgi:hypothetical protein